MFPISLPAYEPTAFAWAAACLMGLASATSDKDTTLGTLYYRTQNPDWSVHLRLTENLPLDDNGVTGHFEVSAENDLPLVWLKAGAPKYCHAWAGEKSRELCEFLAQNKEQAPALLRWACACIDVLPESLLGSTLSFKLSHTRHELEIRTLSRSIKVSPACEDLSTGWELQTEDPQTHNGFLAVFSGTQPDEREVVRALLAGAMLKGLR